MSFVESLNQLRERAISEFCFSMDFKAFTGLSYKFAIEHAAHEAPGTIFHIPYSRFVDQFTTESKAINLASFPEEIAKIRDRHFLPLVHQHQVAVFEYLYFDLLRILLLNQPKHLSQNKKIDFGAILAAESREAIIQILIDKELNETKYKRTKEWFDYLESMVSKCKVSDNEIGQITEAKATRDLLVHSAGIVNQTYFDKSGKFARSVTIGEQISVTGTYTADTWKTMASVIVQLVDILINVFE